MGAELPGLENCPLTIITCSTSCDSGHVVGEAALAGFANERVKAAVTATTVALRIHLISGTA
jgi:hypothetical protein